MARLARAELFAADGFLSPLERNQLRRLITTIRLIGSPADKSEDHGQHGSTGQVKAA